MATETPEQRRLRLQHTNAGNGFERAPLPRPVVEEIPMQQTDLGQTDATRRLNRGESGLGDVVQDSRTRIRTNQQFRNQPSQGDLFTERPEQERMGLNEKSQAALKRAERFTAAPGTITTEALAAQARPRAVGGVLSAGLGASTTLMNAANVYDQTGGDIGETAKQVAYDIPAAIGSTLGTVAGGYLGRRSPAAGATGMLAGGALGDTGGNQIASGADRLLGGDGMSPLQALDAQREAAPQAPLTPEEQQIDATLRGLDNVEIARRAELNGAPALAAPAAAPAAVQAAAPAEQSTPAATPAEAPAEPNGYGKTNIPGVVGRVNEQGVTEFSNLGTDVQGAQGTFDAGGRLGDGQGTFSTYDGQAALGAFERANQIRAGGSGNPLADRQAAQARRAEQTIQLNQGRINGLLQSGKPSDIIQARMLERQNEQLYSQMTGAGTNQTNLALGELEAQVQRERTAASSSGLRDYLSLAREQARQTQNQASGREDIAERNAKNYERDLTNAFAVTNPETGETAVPQERLAMITQRAPAFAQQREAAMRESIQALRQQAATGDASAQKQLAAAEADYNRFRQDIYRVGADGQSVELRPVDEWNPVDRQVFFDDIQTQERLQADRESSVLPEVLGGVVGSALAGSRVPGGPRARAVGALAGAGLGALGGNLAEGQVLGTRSTAAGGPNNASPLLATNYNNVMTEGDNVVATLSDGTVVNLSEFVRENADPNFIGGRGSRTSQYVSVIRTTFDAAAAQLNSSDAAARRQAQDVLAQFARDDALYQSLTEEQRRRLARSNAALGE